MMTEQAISPADVRAGVAEWVKDNAQIESDFGSRKHRSIAAQVDHERALLSALWESGLSQWGWPLSVRGRGGDERHRAATYDALALAGIELPEAFVLLETLAPILVRYAPSIAHKHLSAYLSGREMWAQGFSEPDAGSDLASIRTAAVSTAGGYRVTGRKIWATLGQFAGWAIVLCRTGRPEERHRGLSMLWVDLAREGVQQRPIAAGNGRDEFAELAFDDVFVPTEHLVGGEGQGWSIAMHLLSYERGMYAWLRQASMAHALRSAATTTNDVDADMASVFGAAMDCVQVVRARSGRTVTRLAAGEMVGPEASIDKILLSQAEQAVARAVADLKGTRFLFGASNEDEFDRQAWGYSRASSIFGGAVDVQRDIVSARVLGLTGAK